MIKTEGPTSLPGGYPAPCKELLSGYVGLTQSTTSRDLSTLKSFTQSEESVKALEVLANNYEAEGLSKRMSIIDILETHPNIGLPFSQFIRLLPPMRVRQYSISSNPLANPTQPQLNDSGPRG